MSVSYIRYSMRLLTVLATVFLLGFSTFGQEIAYLTGPHHFILENKGQYPDRVLGKMDGPNNTVWIEKDQVLMVLKESIVPDIPGSQHPIPTREAYIRMELENATEMRVEKVKPTPHYHNFFLGQDAAKWTSKVYGYERMIARDVYPGIDFHWIAEKEGLKSEFVLAPGADARQISMLYEGQQGIQLNRNGDLVLKTALGEIIDSKPEAYQIKNGRKLEVECRYVLRDNRVSFQLGEYDSRLELVIDPILVFATYIGSTTDNFGMTATYAYDGSAYSGGMMFGNNYPDPDPASYKSPNGSTGTRSQFTDVFITKYSDNGQNLQWIAIIGGGDDSTGTETVHSMICDSLDNIYFFGVTSSANFPCTPNALQTAHNGGNGYNIGLNGTNFSGLGTDLYVSKISADGTTLMGSTYFGGQGNDGVNDKLAGEIDSLDFNYGDEFRGEIMLGPGGEVLVATCTRSADIQLVNAVDNTYGGTQEGLIFSLHPDFSALNFSTFWGGSKRDACYSIKVDSSFNLLVAGGTVSTDLTVTPNAYQPTYGGGAADGFILKLNPAGNSVISSTYFGFNQYDQIYFLETDRVNKVFATGQSLGGQVPVTNANFSVAGGANFILKLDSTLSNLERSTTIGGTFSSRVVSPTAFLVDRCGEIYLSGWGANIVGDNIPGFPVTNDAFQSNPHDNGDFYLFVMDRTFSDVLYGSYLGGSASVDHVDGGTSRFDQNGIVYQSICAGCGGHSDFPTTPGAWSATNNTVDRCNNLVFKFDFQVITEANFEVSDTLICLGDTITLSNTSSSSDDYYWDFGNGNTSTEFEPILVYDSPGVYQVKLIVTDSVCQFSDTSVITIHVGPQINYTLVDEIFGCGPNDTTLTVNSFGTVNSFLWSTNNNFSDTLNTYPNDSTIQVPFTPAITYYIEMVSDICRKVDSVTIFNISTSHSLIDSIGLCENNSASVTFVKSSTNIPFTYQWTPTEFIVGATDQPTAIIQPDSSGYVYVQASDNSGCIILDSIFVTRSELPDSLLQATATPDLVAEGATVQLNASPTGLTYVWSPAQGLNNPFIGNPKAVVKENTQFTVLVSDGICSKSASVLVNVYTYACDGERVYLPNAFSPNGDGENDRLFVRSVLANSIELKIFNRWGELVFETNDINRGWDGTYKNALCEPDVYDYYMRATCVNGEDYFAKGNVTLLR